MVRLKRCKFYLCKTGFFKSQFHYGSIKTHNKNSFSGMSTESQFHYGSIKTLVYSKIDFLSLASQFHYGSIKTLATQISRKLKFESQFHYGSIKTKNIFIIGAKAPLISIPLWFD